MLHIGDIYNILFVDSSFCKYVRDKIKNVSTRSDMLKILEESEEKTAWDVLVSDGKLSLIKDNFKDLISYRNDVMHAHNIGEKTYNKARSLFQSANLELEDEINRIFAFKDTYSVPEEYKESIYEILVRANEYATKIGAGMVSTIELINRYCSLLLTTQKINGMEKFLELIAEELLRTQNNELAQKELPKKDKTQ